MTVATPGSGELVPVNGYDDDDLGLDDVNTDDIRIPRIKIIHDEGLFEDTLTKQTFERLECVALGLVKQRIMWPDPMEDGDKPQCKSPNNDYGFPNMRDDIPAAKRFPWETSNFTPDQAVPVTVEPSKAYPEGWNSNSLPVLSCSSCNKSQWNGKVPPECIEQYTFSIMYTPDGGESWLPALISLQKTGIKPARSFVSSFAATKTPMFTVHTVITLDRQKRGNVKFCVPVLTKGGPTDRSDWDEYATRQRAIRKLIRSAPRNPSGEEGDDSVGTPSANVNTGPVGAKAATTPAPAPAPAAAPVATPAPAPAASVPIATPAPAAVSVPASVPVDDDDEPPF